ncbi:MAG: pilin [Patescibacteria group bacterium]
MTGNLNTIIQSLITTFNLLVILLFVMAIVVFAWGIVQLIAAAGSPERLKRAKGILWWGIIGITVLGSISGLVGFLQGAFNIRSDGTITPPRFTPTGGGGGGGFGPTDGGVAANGAPCQVSSQCASGWCDRTQVPVDQDGVCATP